MFWRSSEIIGYGLRATDGSIGSITDLLFDDRNWALRWAVVDTGTWLPGRKVLLPPSALGSPDVLQREFPVDLTRDQVKESPDVATDAPVSRQMESSLYDYYGWTPYWTPRAVASGEASAPVVGIPPAGEPVTGDADLRSAEEVSGYYIKATDGDIGHVEEFLIEDGSWTIRYMVVDTRNWWPGKKVLVSPGWIRDVSWSEQQVHVDLTREQVKESPEYESDVPVERGYEERLYGHYGFSPYWI